MSPQRIAVALLAILMYIKVATKSRNSNRGVSVKPSKSKLRKKVNNPQTNMSKSKLTQGRSIPVATARKFNTGTPTITNQGNSTTITHEEFFFDIFGNTSQTLPTFNSNAGVAQIINPANPALFPWLSGICNSYETYKFLKLEFVYQGLCSTGTGGSVIMAVDYDPTDQSPLTKQDMLAY